MIDPGDEPERILRALQAASLKPVALLHTHAHLDHITGSRRVKEATGAAIRLHPADRPLYDALPEQAAFFGLSAEAPIDPDAPLVRRGDDPLRAARGDRDPHAGAHARAPPASGSTETGPSSSRATRSSAARSAAPTSGAATRPDPRVDPREALRSPRRHLRRLRSRPGHDDRRGEAAESVLERPSTGRHGGEVAGSSLSREMPTVATGKEKKSIPRPYNPRR